MDNFLIGGQIDTLIDFLKFLKERYGDIKISEITAEQLKEAAQIYKDLLK